ncbi:hypothetical protein BJV74DRAFT_876040 [Russula compacta]|nr:hypothetical protein BJV74DRAFT_876040 [Russula compacta]
MDHHRTPALQVQVTQIDYSLDAPDYLDNSTLQKVPVLRIFGASSAGKKCCLHIHQVYPYFFVEYTGKMSPGSVRRYITQLTDSLNYAIAVSLKRDPQSPRSLKGIHFYGFNSSYSPFLKIYIVDPALMSRAVAILQSGSVMGTPFHTFESHLSYVLQFLCDFGLYGYVWQRGVDEDAEEPPFGPSYKPSMALEFDTIAPLIMNRHNLVIPQPSSSSEPLVLGVRELWDDERHRRTEAGLPPANSRGKGGGWVAEARWIEKERDTVAEKWIMTTFESVEALWGDEYSQERDPYADSNGSSPQDVKPITLLFSQELSALGNALETNLGTDDKGHLTDDDQAEDAESPTDMRLGSQSPEPTEHFFLPTSSEEEIDTSNTVNVDHLLSEVGERTEAVTKVCLDNGERRPMKRLRVATEQNVQDLPPRHDLFPSTLAKNEIVFGTLGPRAFSTRAKKEIKNAFVYAISPPPASELFSSLESLGLPSKVYQDPHYSKAEDVPERPWEFAGLVYRLKKGDGLSVLEEWEPSSVPESQAKSASAEDRNMFEDRFDRTGVGGWEYASAPPSVREVRRWLMSTTQAQLCEKPQARSQASGYDCPGPYGFKDTPPAQGAASGVRGKQSMTVFALEVFAPSRGEFVPDPNIDSLTAVFYSFQDSDVEPNSSNLQKGVIIVGNALQDLRSLRDVPSQVVATELDLLNKVVDLVLDLDPDVISGWEIQSSSWGYLGARGKHYGLDMGELISRASGRASSNSSDQWSIRHTSTFCAAGRHVLNLWRITRTELELSMYTLENTVFHLLRRRVPKYAPSTLTEWHNSPVPAHRARLFHHLLGHTVLVLEMLDATDIIAKTAEFARVFGVDFFSVISRGSQFKVESFMFRIAKPESFVLRSPSKREVGTQNAAECMPLIMEPLSAFYNSPLVVLDFQSLYPSVMVAYNYCYSTCLGRVTPFKGQYKFGVAETNLPPSLLATVQDHITIAPNGIMYVKPEVRRGLLGRMLTELLDTRVMVKQAMKRAHDNKTLAKILDARQLGLKYIANVTYGYTSATFSGRMPAVEIADSIVQSGRETLEKAIRFIETNEKWGARVVYGDTDSLFVYLSGKTKEQAFRIGYDIADAVTRQNPVPVKLKFEKVFLPCVLMAKKRYVGFKYESPDDTEPVFDAKGIETVRRDGVPAQRKMAETALKILFRTQDLSVVKRYCYRSWLKILENKVSIQDFIFAREVRMGTYSDKVPPPPGVIVAARRQLEDPNNEAQYGDRIPYVIARGTQHERLVDRAVAPEELFDGEKQLDGSYYISRVLIPPLERIFNLVGADIRGWYEEMPRRIRADGVDTSLTSPEKPKGVMTPGRLRIEEHFRNSQCILCRSFSDEGLCKRCCTTPAETISGLLSQVRITENRLQTVHNVCTMCTRSEPLEPVSCISLDCPWLFQRKKAEQQAEDIELLQELIQSLELGDNIKQEGHDDSDEENREDHEMSNSEISWSWHEMGEQE